jgi:hypothetical protein
MNVLRYNDVTDHHESISLAHLFENGKEAVAPTRPVQKGQSSIAGTGDKVQVMRAVGAMQTAGHGKSHGIGSIDTRPCKKRKDEAPTVSKRESKDPELWATRPGDGREVPPRAGPALDF